MKQFNNILAIFCLLLLATPSVNGQTPNNELKLTAILRGSYRFPESENHKYFLVDVTLSNNSDSVCSFFAFTCQTNMNFLTNSDQVVICSNDCARNFPTLVSIKPKQDFALPLILKTDSNSPNINKTIKIGFVLVKNKPPHDFIEMLIGMKVREENIIWSDPFLLQVGGGIPYSIF